MYYIQHKNNLTIIQEYFQPKIGRKIRIFSLGQKNNILIKKKKKGREKECTATRRFSERIQFEYSLLLALIYI